MIDAGEVGAGLPAARGEAAGDRDRGLDRHAVDEGILAGGRHFAEDEERPEGLDLDRDVRLAQEAVRAARLERALERWRWSCRRPGPEPISGIEMCPAPSTE